ncbi:MAG TPA: DEAD/DEAH box helicase, partial [Acetobacteraceae bacterium]|nr:DEAD/DEAH box helicase [Acetobacteraceae bacterium]
MRPQSLTPLFAQVTSLPGIGPRLGKLVERLTGPLVVDLLWHLPSGVIDRRNAPEIAKAEAGTVATITVTVDEHIVPHNRRQPYRVWCSDETGRLCLTYFNGHEDYLKKLLPIGERRVVSGKVELYQGEAQMTHPDHVVPLEELQSILRVEPVYGLTGGLTQRPLQKSIAAAVERAPELPEWQDAAYLRRQKWSAWKAALAAAHAPADEGDLSPTHPARARLAFDELLASQLAIALVRHHNRSLPGRTTRGDGRLQKRALAALPFQLTPSQIFATAEIAADMAKGERMVRLLQGDVGSGKTLVAFLAMLTAVEAGTQAALMAPTELLARQHYATIAPLAEAAGVTLALLTGRDGSRQKKATLQGLADGT